MSIEFLPEEKQTIHRKMSLVLIPCFVDRFHQHINMVAESTNRRNVKTRQQYLL